MVVVVIIGLLAALAVAAFRRIKIEAENTTIANDLRTFSAAFETYNLSNGAWPSRSPGPGELPPEMVDAIKPEAFAHCALPGFSYMWASVEANESGGEAAGLLFMPIGDAAASNITPERLMSLDQKIDDGNLETGSLQLYLRQLPVYFIVPPKADSAAAALDNPT